MSEPERGPTWYDVSAYAEWLADTYAVSVELRLCRPAKRVNGSGYTPWAVCAHVTSRLGTTKYEKGFHRPWGSGGAARTAPGAAYAALLDAEHALDERQASAAKQAAF